MGAGIAEIGQHPVAHVSGDEPLKPCDDLGDGTVVGAGNLAQILGVETRGQRRRPDEIAEHDGQLPALHLGGDSGCELGQGLQRLPPERGDRLEHDFAMTE